MLSVNREKYIIILAILLILGSLGVIIGAVIIIYFSSTQVAYQTFTPITGTGDAIYQPILGLVTNNKYEIIDVMSGSAADKAGLQRGDIIVELDGISFRNKNFSLEQAQQQIRDITSTLEGQWVSITIDRRGQELTLTIQPTRFKYQIHLTPLPNNLIHI